MTFGYKGLLGCPLSPVMGAFFLLSVDQELGELGLFYVRFMDDIVVLAPTRWKLRGAVTALNQALGALRLKKHPDAFTRAYEIRQGRPSSAGLKRGLIFSAITSAREG